MNAPAAASSAFPRKFGISIGTKFLVLIAVILAITFSAILFNATRMFKRDNLDSVSLSSDLLTAAKAAQVRTWANGLLGRAALIARSPKSVPEHAETELLLMELFSVDSTGRRFTLQGRWNNLRSMQALGFSKGDKPMEAPIEEPVIGKDAIRFQPWKDRRSGKRALLLTIAPTGSQRLLARFVVSDENLSGFFSDTGPYTFALLNSAGHVLAHKDPSVARRPDSMISVPIVKKMLVSTVDRELTEFKIGEVPYLGAYYKVGVGGLGVVNTVSRAIALETGNTLIRRSSIIGALVFFLAFIVSYLFIQGIVSPILSLRQAALDISAGDFSQQSRSARATRWRIWPPASTGWARRSPGASRPWRRSTRRRSRSGTPRNPRRCWSSRSSSSALSSVSARGSDSTRTGAGPKNP